MSYVLLWIETLLACLLFLALVIVNGQRRKARTAKALCAVAALLPLVPLGAQLMLTWGLRYVSNLRDSGFGWAITLSVCYFVGAIALWIMARKRDAAGIRRAVSWPLARIATAWLVVISLMAMTLWNLDLRAQVEIQALRAEAGAMALSVAPPAIPDSANAAILYEKTRERFEAATTAADKDVDYRDETKVNSAQGAAYLQRQEKTLQVLRQAADMPECRLDYDYDKPDVGAVLTLSKPFRTWSILLSVAATSEAASGKVELAMADCRRIYATGNHLNAPPILISGLTTLAIDALATNTVARVLPAVTSKEQLDSFTPPEPPALSRAFARMLRGEEAFGLAMFADLGSGQGQYARTLRSGAGGALWFAWLRDDVGIYREYMQRQRDIAQQPYYQTADARKKIEEELRPGKRRGVMSAIVMPSILKSIESLAKTQVLRASVGVACAATRYRLDHGQYPATSDLLVPGYLEAMPVDPFDGQAMRMKKQADGSLVIYSVGADGKDDGGVVDSPDSKTRPTDVGITLKMPAGR